MTAVRDVLRGVRFRYGDTALVFLALAALLVPWWTSSEYVTVGLNGYAVDTTAGATAASRVLGPLWVAVAALEGARLRHAVPLRAAATRSVVSVLWNRMWPLASAALAGSVLSFFVVSAHAPGPLQAPSWALAGTYALVLAGYGTVGLLLGRFLPAPVAVPVGLVAGFLLVGLPFSSSIFWIRHLTGDFSGCCGVGLTIDPTVLLGAGGFAIVCIAVAVAATAIRRTAIAAMVTAVGVAAGAVLGYAVLGGYGDANTVDRHDGTVCQTGEVTVCVWPERADLLPLLVSSATALRATVRSHGVELPTTLSMEAPTVDDPSSYWVFGLSPSPSPSQATQYLARGLVPNVRSDCADPGYAQRAWGAYYALSQWLLVDVLKLDVPTIPGASGPPGGATQAWFTELRTQIIRCGAG